MLSFMKEKFSSWEKIERSGLPVVLYGMGNGADKVLDELIRLGIPVKGVTASDSFVRGQSFRGFTVKKLSEFDGEFIIAVSFASCIPQVIEHIYSLTEKYRVIVPCVPVCEGEIFNRSFIDKNAESLMQAYDLFDDESKAIFAGCVDFMFGGELPLLKEITSEKDEIFGGFLQLGANEVYLDLGAYRGDTIEELLKYTAGAYSSIIAVEPDKRSFRKLSEYAGEMPNVTLCRKAVHSQNATAFFNSAAGRQSALSDNGDEIQTTTIDELCYEQGVSYIKMDVEGAEYEALCGGEKVLAEYKPKLNIALYHRSEDIFRLPLKIAQINPDYQFRLRKHPYIPCWDMNLYAK